MQFSCIHTSVILSRNQIIFIVEMQANLTTLRFKFQLNRAKCFRYIKLQKLAEFLCFFSSFRKVVIKHKIIHYLNALKFGTLNGRIRVHPDTKFGCNTLNVH